MLKDKIKSRADILLYGITPPKLNTNLDEISQIADKYKARVSSSNIDGFVIYDLQDESNRNQSERTFEFFSTLNPELYHQKFLSEFEAILYKVVGKCDESEFLNYLSNLPANSINVFVGASSKKDATKLSLKQAYKMSSKFDLTLGGICIPERHHIKDDEQLRVARKSIDGCQFFITQAIYDIQRAKKFIDDYAKLNIQKCPIIVTLTPCGSQKTLDFMRWLGIYIDSEIENKIISSHDPLEKSVNLSIDIFEFLYKYAKNKGITIGANIESISKRKVEIDASIKLLNSVRQILK